MEIRTTKKKKIYIIIYLEMFARLLDVTMATGPGGTSRR